MTCVAHFRFSRVVMPLVAVLLALMISTVSAAPQVSRTTPLDGEILQRTPTAVGVGFDQALNQDQSTFRLLTTDGADVAGTTLSWGVDSTSVTIQLPRDFADGVYTIVWHAVSEDDGTASDGWSSFSVGNPQDANIITIPTTESPHSGLQTWLQIGARWIALAGIALVTALWPILRGVIRPLLGRHRPVAVRTTLLLQRLTWAALALAFVGSMLDLIARGIAEKDTNATDGIFQTLGQSDWGFWWIARMILLVMLGIGLALSPWWRTHRTGLSSGALWLISLLLPLPFAVSGHAMDDEVGRIPTVVTSYLFLLALFIIVGGSCWIAVAHRAVATAEGAPATVRTRARWPLVAGALTLLFTGTYLGWLFAGNSDALQLTMYGRFLTVAIIIAVAAAVLATVYLLRRGSAQVALSLAAVGLVLLLPVAGMHIATPARAEIEEDSVQARHDLSFDGRDGILLVAPGRTGVNHIRLETPGTYLQTETEVFLDLSSPDHPELGSKSVQMYRVQGNAFEHHGTEFSLDGAWQVTVRIEEPGFPSSTSTFERTFGAETSSVQVPAAPWKLTTLGGLAGIGLALAGVLGVATAVSTGGPLRKEAGGLAAIALALAAVVIVQGRIDSVLVVESGEGAINPNDAAMVARGEEAYATYCLSCHGAGLRGDGPLAAALNPPPADFSAPHTKVHTNADLVYWIQYGIQGTAMPGFRSQMDDQAIRDVIAYIQWWQQNPEEAAAATPSLGVCEVDPLGFADIPEIFHHGIHPTTRRGTPLVRAADAEVAPEQTNEVMWTIEQMVNCANQDQYLSQLRLYTPALLQEIYPQGASWDVTSNATSPSEPVDPADAIAIQDVQSVTYLADGRVAVTVIFSDPAGIGVIPGAQPVYQVTLVLVYENGAWLVDEVR